jgi:hypothetical protein
MMMRMMTRRGEEEGRRRRRSVPVSRMRLDPLKLSHLIPQRWSS